MSKNHQIPSTGEKRLINRILYSYEEKIPPPIIMGEKVQETRDARCKMQIKEKGKPRAGASPIAQARRDRCSQAQTSPTSMDLRAPRPGPRRALGLFLVGLLGTTIDAQRLHGAAALALGSSGGDGAAVSALRESRRFSRDDRGDRAGSGGKPRRRPPPPNSPPRCSHFTHRNSGQRTCAAGWRPAR